MSRSFELHIGGTHFRVAMHSNAQLNNAGNQLRNVMENMLGPTNIGPPGVQPVGHSHQHQTGHVIRFTSPGLQPFPSSPELLEGQVLGASAFQGSPSVVIDLPSTEPGFVGNINPPPGTEGSNSSEIPVDPTPQSSRFSGMPAIRTLAKLLEGSFPFLILALVKITYDHRIGILIFVAMYGTFFHANSSLRSLILRRDSHYTFEYAGNLAWICAFIVANIFFVYFAFADQKLYRSLYFMCPEVENLNLWSLLWVVGTTDFVIKYATVFAKALVTSLPRLILSSKRKGRYYHLLEILSQFYRSLVPIVPWVYFLLDDKHGGRWFSLILLAAYIFCKGQDILEKGKELKQGLQKFKLEMTYGVVPNRSQLESYENCCPICQDKFTDPVMLSCNHIFCEECVVTWFSRERTCPMCRANIIDDPRWRDGITSSTLQFY